MENREERRGEGSTGEEWEGGRRAQGGRGAEGEEREESEGSTGEEWEGGRRAQGRRGEERGGEERRRERRGERDQRGSKKNPHIRLPLIAIHPASAIFSSFSVINFATPASAPANNLGNLLAYWQGPI